MVKIYVEVYEKVKVFIFDYVILFGGIWVIEWLYFGLKINNIVGIYEFSDFLFVFEKYGIVFGQYIFG